MDKRRIRLLCVRTSSLFGSVLNARMRVKWSILTKGCATMQNKSSRSSSRMHESQMLSVTKRLGRNKLPKWRLCGRMSSSSSTSYRHSSVYQALNALIGWCPTWKYDVVILHLDVICCLSTSHSFVFLFARSARFQLWSPRTGCVCVLIEKSRNLLNWFYFVTTNTKNA